MSVIGSNILAGASGQGGGYNLTNSLRFRSSASAYLNRTGSTATNAKLATYSFWFKRGILTTGQWLFTGGTTTTLIGFNGSSDALSVLGSDISGEGNITTAVFRDPSAWYHVVIAIDTSQVTTADRAKIYVNGVLQAVTVLNGGIAPNSNWGFNTAGSLTIGRYSPSPSSYVDGYLTEVNFIDGLALTPSSFGETSATTGVWIPKKYTGTYGTNGFYLPFTDNSALTTSSNVGLGKDFSGNSNYWTTNNISITSGSTYDSMTDVPTLTSATASNYAVLNPLQAAVAPSNANLQMINSSGWQSALGTMGVSSGKWYWEAFVNNQNNAVNGGHIGIAQNSFVPANYPGYNSTSYAYRFDGDKVNNASFTAYGATWTQGDTIGVALDMDAGTLTFYKNNSSQGVAFSSLSGVYMPILGVANSPNTISMNFGQQPFAYTPPTGFLALNTFNLPTPTIGATASTTANKYFDALLWTGNGTTQNITTANFQPDWLWVKERSEARSNLVWDAVRGSNLGLITNTTSSESAQPSFTGFLSNGFGVSNTDASDITNKSSQTYVGWIWKANGAGSTNTAGSITSTVSANTSAGFSIVTYTGNATNGATVGHGLGVTPSMIIIKVRNASARWVVYQKDVTTANNQFLELNSTIAVDTSGTNFWTIASTNSTTFGLGTNGDTNGSALNFVAYCFAPVAGYSAFGSYTGNGSSDGTFVYLGFRPRFVMIKSTIETSNWFIYDTARNTYNAIDTTLFPSASNADYVDSTYAIDVVSNGFKIRGTGQYGGYNNNGNAYVYACFAESPFKYSNAR